METKYSTAVMELRKITAEFNLALRKSVNDKCRELSEKKATDMEIYKFNFESAKKEKANLNDPVPVDSIEYYWIEYASGKGENKGKKMKFAFFYRDVDKNTGNVHVIPGLFEEYKYEKKDYKPENYPNKPYVADNEKVVIKNIKLRYSSFSEKDMDGGWWVPMSDCIPLKDDNKSVDDKAKNFGTIADFKTIFNKFFDCEFAVSAVLVKELSKEKVEMGHQHHLVSERYTPLFWYNIKINKKILHYMDLFKELYFKHYGFFIQYNCINFTEKEEKKSEKTRIGKYVTEDITTNYPIVSTGCDYEKQKAPSLTNEDFTKIKNKVESYLKKIQNKQ